MGQREGQASGDFTRESSVDPGVRRLTCECAAFALLLVGLMFARAESFLLFHALAEISTVIMAAGIVLLVWCFAVPARTLFPTVLATGVALAGGFDTVHALTLAEIGVFPDLAPSPELAGQFSLSARIVLFACLAGGVLTIYRPQIINSVCAFVVFCAAVLLALIITKNVPPCSGVGDYPTPFKVVSLMIGSAAMAVAAWFVSRRRDEMGAIIADLIVAALVLLAASSFFWAGFDGGRAVLPVAGHFVKVAAYCVLLKATMEICIGRLAVAAAGSEEAVRRLHGSELAAANRVLQAEIERRAEMERKLNELVLDLKVSNAELEQFAYVASHDLREPVRMIGSYIGLIERRHGETLDSEAHEFLAFARDGACRMDRMITDLLDFSRIGRIGDPPARVDLSEAVSVALSNLSPQVTETAAEVAVEGALPAVEARRNEMVRLFQNLIGNALKYRRDDVRPKVTIETVQTGGAWQITVADNGIGIAPESRERVFDIFTRLHRQEEYAGTGIGLAICRKIVQHQGGRIWVDANLGGGSTFFVELPVQSD